MLGGFIPCRIISLTLDSDKWRGIPFMAQWGGGETCQRGMSLASSSATTQPGTLPASSSAAAEPCVAARYPRPLQLGCSGFWEPSTTTAGPQGLPGILLHCGQPWCSCWVSYTMTGLQQLLGILHHDGQAGEAANFLRNSWRAICQCQCPPPEQAAAAPFRTGKSIICMRADDTNVFGGI